ncbi:MFS transporter [Longispora sp. NPDC051575]|uniref:MFS transporter n=1 Tax=Longispora sp. NPDC051575 TaxID=3154943 RepID=UPI00342AD1D4
MTRLAHNDGYRRFWAASAVSVFGTHVTTIALQILVVEGLRATTTQYGLVSSAQWLPYLLFGLVAGVLIDRHRRRPVLVWADLGRGLVLAAIPLLYLGDALSLPTLAGLLFCFGLLSVLFDTAEQAYLPRLVPRELLTPANARLQLTMNLAQTAGPALGGVLIRVVTAPIAIVVDAVSYLVSALLLATIRTPEPAPQPAGRRDLRHELREGLTYVYGHRLLRAHAVNGHLWFLVHSALATVLTFYVVEGSQLGLGAFGLGLVYAAGGVGAVLGNTLSSKLSARLGAGRTMVLCAMAKAVPWLLVVFARPGPAALPMVALGLFGFWLLLGVCGPVEMGWRQSITPDALQARMGGTIRSVNRAAIVVGAPLGGLLADHTSHRLALWAGIVGLAVTGCYAYCSPLRGASFADAPPESLPVSPRR